MQWASLWPSSVIKTGVSLATQSALFCHPSQPLLAPPGYLLSTFSVRPFVCSIRESSRFAGNGVLYTLALLLLLFLRFVGSGRSSSVTRAVSALLRSRFSLYLSALLRITSTLRFSVPLYIPSLSLSRKQRCEIYLNPRFPFFSFSSRLHVFNSKSSRRSSFASR